MWGIAILTDDCKQLKNFCFEFTKGDGDRMYDEASTVKICLAYRPLMQLPSKP